MSKRLLRQPAAADSTTTQRNAAPHTAHIKPNVRVEMPHEFAAGLVEWFHGYNGVGRKEKFKPSHQLPQLIELLQQALDLDEG